MHAPLSPGQMGSPSPTAGNRPAPVHSTWHSRQLAHQFHFRSRFFLFYIFKKLKFQKYMSVLKYFKNIPRSLSIGRQAQSVIFFSSNLQRSPWRKKRGPVAPQRATGACRPPLGRQTPVARWGGDRPPCRPLWGRRAPFFSPGTSLQI